MIIYGKNTVTTSLAHGENVHKVYLSEGSILKAMIQKDYPNIKIVVCKTIELDKLTNNGNHQGIACEVDDYKYKTLEEICKKLTKENCALALLDGLEDPHNLGAILRTADACGIDGIILPKNRSVGLTPIVAKVSTGAIEYVDCCQVANSTQALKYLKKMGYWVIGLELDGTIDYRQQDYLNKIVVVIGSEGKGISRLVKEQCDFLVKIPMCGHVNSLNASVSAGILFYEIHRQQNPL